MRGRSSAIPLLGLLLLGIVASPAQTIFYHDFASVGSALSINGDAAAVTTSDGSVLRISPTLANQAGTVFTTSQFNVASFSTVFQFRFTGRNGITDGNRNGADGITFAVQNAGSANVGGIGSGIGYEGIGTSVAVEFDTFFNNGFDPAIGSGGSNHIGLDTNGSMTSLFTAPIATNLDDGDKWTVWIDYNGTTLEVRMSIDGLRPTTAILSQSINIPTTVGGSNAYLGFTSGTGGANTNHDLLNWAFADTYVANGLSAVPEPGTVALLGLGGLMLLGASRFRRAR